MMPLRLKLKQFGNSNEPIGELQIFNDLTGTPALGNYVATISDKKGRTRKVRVEGHQREMGAWYLVFLVLGKFIAAESDEIREIMKEALDAKLAREGEKDVI
jgi:hypothetical protein